MKSRPIRGVATGLLARVSSHGRGHRAHRRGGFGQTTTFTAGAGPGGGPARVNDGLGPALGVGYVAGISGGGSSFCGLGGTGTRTTKPTRSQ